MAGRQCKLESRRILIGLMALACAYAGALADTKFIRLRNETIATSEPARAGAVQPQAVAPPVSGLFLVQFNDRFEPAWREQLRRAGGELLRYVPEDAFVVRLSQARLDQLRALPFVRWLGQYRPEHKVQALLRPRLGQGAAPDSSRPVSALLAPGAAPGDLLAVRRAFQTLQRVSRSRFGLIVQGTLKAGQLDALAQSAAVLWIEPAPRPKLYDEIAAKIVGGPNPEGHATATQQLGFTGKGVIVGVADSGLNNGDAETMHPDLAGRVDAFLFYGQLENAADEHSHGTHVTGIIAGNGATGETDENGYLYGLGVAPQAHVVAQRIFDADGNYEPPPSNEALTHDAVRHGAVIGSNSWGDDTQGRYDLNAAQFDELVRDADSQTPGGQPYVLEFSAGNAGPGAQTIGSPAVAKNVIATGASENDRPDFFIYSDGPEAMADFSSRGPAEDGRLKPDLVAPGTWIASLQSASATDLYAWWPISADYQYQGGTSHSGPHVSGAAAVFVQYYRETHGGVTPSPALVKAALINSAADMADEAGTEPTPNLAEGWGRADLANLIGSARRYEFVDQTVLLTNRQSFEARIVVGNPDQPLKITLVYTDPPGFPAALPALVNDLDLEVVGPGGALYRGNQFDQGDSIPNPGASDRLNNVEAVHLLAPEPGEYLVRVRAQNVVEDVFHRTNAPPQQDFALVISGDLPLPGVGVLLFDRGAYAAPGTIQIKLIDFDLAGQASVNVRVQSASEPAGENVLLGPCGAAGVFTGAVATVTGPPVSDGRLQIKHGDAIEAQYQDASPPATRSATAVADFVPPVISAVGSTTRFGRAFISWDTDEPANAIVRYGLGPNLTLAATNSTLATHHQLTLTNLTPGVTYSFLVTSADEAGNAATDDNNGRFYSVMVQPPPIVLVVDANQDPFGLFDIPVSTYTDALEQAGISYEVWDVPSEGRTPRLAELKSYRVVMWRVPELVASLSATDLKAIRDYLDGGGGLFIASMELLTRLDESGFTSFRKNVLHVESFDTDSGVEGIIGMDNISLTSGVETDLDYSAYPDLIIISPDISDTFQPTTNAAPVLFDVSSGKAAGVRYPRTGEDSPGRVIFFSFPLDTIPFDAPDPSNRPNVVRNIVSFLAPGVNGLGTMELDREAYSVPARVEIEVADADLAGSGSLTVAVYTDRQPQGRAIALNETPRAGLFRGSVTLVDDANAAAADQVGVRDGDLLMVEYHDAAPPRPLLVAAAVETTVPAISEVRVAPDYSEAVVEWHTSEPTDALVQFGESTFLGRTAYANALTDTHSIALAGLLPDRQYFFQVTSRDAAGNAVTDNNGGKLYTFRTLKPLQPPFVDDLEHGAANWTVANDELNAEFIGLFTSSAWQLGRPQNELASQAHSGANAWGTNLGGEANDYASTSLITPAIELAGGNFATLRFWHNYDFTPRSEEGDILEQGAVYVTTNNGGAWIPLAQYDLSSGGWEDIELDLTPYIGYVVRVGWAYGLLSMEAVAHPGWLVDDVSVTVTNVERGTIIVTNNLAQARFQLTGPLEQSGAGWSLVLSNAPPGSYVLAYEPVPFYVTPSPQTNVLSGTNTIVFAGDYTFADANGNGLSDAWEQQFFGAVLPNRPADVDTDGDGQSDYAEFIAGANPTNAQSVLCVLPPAILPNRTVQLEWPSAPGHAYRAHLSTNLVEWLPASAWLIATNTNSAVILPPLATFPNCLFRLEVRP
jgi:hypothetical protein